MWDEEEEKLQMVTIEHLQWLVIQEVWLLLLKCVPRSIRGIIRVVRANYNMAIMSAVQHRSVNCYCKKGDAFCACAVHVCVQCMRVWCIAVILAMV